MLLLLSLCLCLLSSGVLGSSYASFYSCCACEAFCMIHTATVMNCTIGRDTYSYSNTEFQFWNDNGDYLGIKFSGYSAYDICFDVSIEATMNTKDVLSVVYSNSDYVYKACNHNGCCDLYDAKCTSPYGDQFSYYNGFFSVSTLNYKMLITGMGWNENFMYEFVTTPMTKVLQLGYFQYSY
jgi:hypothetical protein